MSASSAPDGREAVGAFYASFYVSQGNYADQHDLFDALAYKASRERDLFAGGIAALQTIEFDALLTDNLLQLPARHRPVRDFAAPVRGTETEIIAQTFRDRWNDFTSRLWEPVLQDEAGYRHRLNVLAGHMIERDLYWVAQGRPNRNTEEERFRSLYREHVLRGRTCGSKVVDVVMSDMRENASALPDTPRRREALTELWESHFPDQSFEPVSEGLIFTPTHLQ